MPKSKKKSLGEQYKEYSKKAYDSFQRVRDLEKEVEGTVWAHKLLLPEPPKTWTAIPNAGLAPKNRKFPYYDESFIKKVEKMDIDDYIYLDYGLKNILGMLNSHLEKITKEEFLNKEREFWTNGYWFYNKDKLEYVTGYHYLTLQYWKISVKDAEGRTFSTTNPKFVDMHRDRQYCIKYIMEEQNSTGLVYVGCRRSGKTMEMGAVAYFDTMTQYKGYCSIQSKTDDDAVTLFKEHIMTPWRRLPNFLQPDNDGSKNPTKAFHASPPAGRDTKSSDFEYSEYLESHMETYNAGEMAVDGRRSTFQINDEYGKMKLVKATDRHDKNIECTVQGSTIIGFAYWSTTVEEMERKGGKEAMLLWEGASPNNLDGDGRTQNYLTRLFFPAYYGMFEGKNLKTGEPLIDEWGYSNVEAAIEYLDSREKGKKDEKLLELRRKYPRTIDDAFRINLSMSPFDQDKLKQHKLYNEAKFEETNRTAWTRGNFEWVDGIPFGKVFWNPTPDGRWQMLALPDSHLRNQWKIHRGEKTPMFTFAVSSLDPFAYSDVSESTNKPSMSASHVMMEYGKLQKPTVVCQYYYRTKTARKMWEDILKQCIFYSCPLAVERTTFKAGMAEYFDEHGYIDYVMPDPRGESKDIAKDRAFPSSKEMKQKLLEEGVAYVEKYVGYNDKMNVTTDFVFDELIDDLLEFNPEKWTPSDLTVSFTHLVVGWNYRKKHYSRPKHERLFQSPQDWGITKRKK